MRRQQTPQLTGPDYLILVAQDAAGHPYAADFGRMVMDCFVGHDGLIGPMIAKRPLKAHEASPVVIVTRAVQMALERGDTESAIEALNVGLSLVAKWPSYLMLFDGATRTSRTSTTARSQSNATVGSVT